MTRIFLHLRLLFLLLFGVLILVLVNNDATTPEAAGHCELTADSSPNLKENQIH